MNLGNEVEDDEILDYDGGDPFISELCRK